MNVFLKGVANRTYPRPGYRIGGPEGAVAPTDPAASPIPLGALGGGDGAGGWWIEWAPTSREWTAQTCLSTSTISMSQNACTGELCRQTLELRCTMSVSLLFERSIFCIPCPASPASVSPLHSFSGAPLHYACVTCSPS